MTNLGFPSILSMEERAMENLIFSLNATVPVFLMMVLGYVLRRLKVVD